MSGNKAEVLICANCHRPGTSACKACLLVLYCGRECQRTHWIQHKQVCRSSLSKSTWQPEWISEKRTPTFVGGAPLRSFGGKKFFWGNVPALDLLRLKENEGDEFREELSVLFAASGDLRNVIKTIASIPQACESSIFMVVNDLDFDIVARNVILLLVALVVEGQEEAVSCMLHVWYSASIRTSHLDLLASRIRPLIEDVNAKIAGRAAGKVFGKTWRFEHRSLRLELTKDRWASLLWYFDVPQGLSLVRAQQVRTAVTLADERKDYREQSLISQLPAHRVCTNRFREDGILLPFGHSRDGFDIPNPTFCQTAVWPMKDSADPLDGWNPNEILSIDIAPATNDVYGKLFCYLTSLLTSFHRRLASHGAKFQLVNVNATDLPDQLGALRFARIEVANISDGGYLGVAKTSACMGPLLQTPHENPNATLLMLFMNAVDEEAIQEERNADIENRMLEMKRVIQYIPFTTMPPSAPDYTIESVLRASSLPLVRDLDMYFNKYLARHNLRMIEQYCGLAVKDRHTIVEEWPLRLKLRPNQVGAQEEFEILASSAHTGAERYVEWKRTF